MKTVLVSAFILASVLAAPVHASAPATDMAIAVCDDSVPEEWRRPGGFCEQQDSTKSLTGPVEGCTIVLVWNLMVQKPGARIDVASVDPCDPCSFGAGFSVPAAFTGDRIRVAVC